MEPITSAVKLIERLVELLDSRYTFVRFGDGYAAHHAQEEIVFRGEVRREHRYLHGVLRPACQQHAGAVQTEAVVGDGDSAAGKFLLVFP